MNLSERELRVRAVAARCRGLVRQPGMVRQTNDCTCVHACLAMVTGMPIADVTWALGDHCGLADEQSFGFLGLCGIIAKHIGPGHFPRRGPVYMGTVPSLNIEFASHQVVMFARGNEWVIRDPNQGRPGKRVMTVRRMLSGRPRIFNWIELTQPTFWSPNDPIRKPEVAV